MIVTRVRKGVVLAAATAALLCAQNPADAAPPSPSGSPSAASSPGPSPSASATPTASPAPTSTTGTPAPPPAVRPPTVPLTVLLGRSVLGRPIYAYRRGTLNARRRILVVGNIHGDEPAGDRVVAALLRQLGMLHVEVWLLPSINPDGTAAGRHGNAHGVDLNRNFPSRWQPQHADARHDSGPYAASEPETRAYMAFVRTYRFQTVVIFHQPFGCVDYSNSLRQLSDRMAAVLGEPTCTLGSQSGSNAGWTQAVIPGSVALTVEFPATAGTALITRAVIGVRQVASLR